MELLNIFALLLALTAVFSYLNHRFIGLPVSIGVRSFTPGAVRILPAGTT